MKHWFVRWLMLGVLALLVVPAWAQQPQVERAAPALSYIKGQQQADGSFSGFGLGSTADAIFALAAGDVKIDALTVNGNSAQTFIEGNIGDIAAKPGSAAKYIIAELLAGHSPRNVGGTDLVAALQQSYSAATGMYGSDITTHALAILALVAAGEPVPQNAISALEQTQISDGSWSFTGDTSADSGDTNTTSLVLQALVAADQRQSPLVERGLAYLQTQRNADGGFPYAQSSQYGNASDANSTALVIQAIIATGGSPVVSPWADANGNPLQALLQLQNDSGAFRYTADQPDDNAFATYQAVPALLLKPFPLEALAVINQPAPSATPAPSAPVELPNTGSPGQPQPWLALIGVGAIALLLLGAQLRRRTA